MSYCINPKCPNRENPKSLDACQSCGSSLLINDRYRVVKPLRQPNPAYPTDIFEVKDLGGVDEWGTLKVMKVLKFNKHPNLVRLFKQEARALMFLKVRGVPKVEPDDYFIFSPNTGTQNLHCLVMEKIDGENLADWLQINGQISQEQALDWLQQLVEILDEVHQQNLWHRDIKPSNIILRPNGRLALIDFGAVRVKDGGATQVGSEGYTAPEQIIGEAVLQSDFFALGRTFVHLLTGIPPKDFPTQPKTGKLIWRESVRSLKPPTPRSKLLADLIDDLIEPVPESRPKNTREIFKRLQTIAIASDTPPSNFRKFKAVLLFLGFIGFPVLFSPLVPAFANNFLTPKLASFFTTLGTENYSQRQLQSAEFFYRLALKYNPDSGAAHYSIGVVCEAKSDFNCARTQYLKAMGSKNDEVAVSAISNLARWHILSGDKATAVNLLLPNLERSQHPRVKAALYKNLGWAELEQQRYNEAEAHLEKAIALYSQWNWQTKWAPLHCLLARVLEAKGNKAASLVEWDNCERYASQDSPEEFIWKEIATKRLKAAGKKL